MTTPPPTGSAGSVDGDRSGEEPQFETAAGGPGAERAGDRVVGLEDRLRRSLADFENLRKRFDREVGRERAAERERVAAAWLPVIDDLERALDHAGADPESLLSGVSAIRDQAVDILGRLGFTRFEVVGTPFDPIRHEALGTVDGDGPAGTVVVALRPGYGTDDVVLRPAGVMVSTGRA